MKCKSCGQESYGGFAICPECITKTVTRETPCLYHEINCGLPTCKEKANCVGCPHKTGLKYPESRVKNGYEPHISENLDRYITDADQAILGAMRIKW
jgi:hypothetical protein